MLRLPAAETAAGLPGPGVGVFFKADAVPRLRENVRRPPCQGVYAEIVKSADTAVAQWPGDKARLRIEELAPKLLDLSTEFVPQQFLPDGGKEAGRVLEEYATRGAPCAAFVYLMTGEHKYAELAWDVFEQCAKTNRLGWFPWAGSHMPQIHFGIVSRNLVLVADCVWETLTPAQRQHAREVLAEKCVEPYFRLVLHTPGMGLYHLRSLNQGNNALAAAVVGSVFVGEAVPENGIWFNSVLQTYHWAITHDVGWMGQGLEAGMPGYWSVSTQNLYTAASALYNVRGIDLRAHPGFDQATYYPLVHESTVPPVGMFADAIRLNPVPAKDEKTVLVGVIAGKPIELPHEAYCGPWWLDYAARCPESPAHYFASKLMIRPDKIRAADAHQAALTEVLKIAWWDDKLLAAPQPPTALALFTDRMAGVRSGYGFGETYLYFNGDMFLSAKKEILCTTAGLSWHYPWHQYQIAETGVEMEGEPFAPSMIIKEASAEPQFVFFRAEAGYSNVTYYAQAGQRESYQHYAKRERCVLYARASGGTGDYFVFVDDVQPKDGRPHWYAWTWHLWNSVANRAGNYGRFVPQGAAAVRAERPNADLWIQFVTPASVAIEQHGIPGQPHVSYQMDHNTQMLRAVAGGYEAADAKTVIVPPTAWAGLGVAEQGALYMEKPPTEKTFSSQTVTGLTGGVRYRWSLKAKEEKYRVYEATAWELGLELLDAQGRVLAKPVTKYGHPDPLRLGAPLSDTLTHDWTETVQYFDAPEGAVACRASFRAVGGAHYFQLGKLWLSPIEVVPVGKPRRTPQQRFVTLVVPLDKNAAPPKIETREGRVFLSHANGAVDEIAVPAEGRMSLRRTDGGKTVAEFGARDGQAAPAGALKTNSDANARQLLAGLKPVLDELAAQRDALTRKGRRNMAAGAAASASATRDERFPPANVLDNQTAEYPADGHLDYTLGIVWSSGLAGYGAGKDSLLNDRRCFPLYVKPCYWLLPEGQLGWVEVALQKPETVDLVRLLNTSNAGLNDFATHTFKVELYDAERKLLASKEDAFGKVCDRPFKQAFAEPKWFSRYTPTFAGMLEPGLTVPFGDGWKEIGFPEVRGVKFVRVVVTKYWGIGAGLNEIQVYGP
ncbi:MAG: hypothetical protein NTW87_12690 [Planctomycetota bacterium]|nr:hypothetical protein [Planctomycetota bacterium]